MNSEENFDTSMLETLVILFYLFKKQIGKGSFEPGNFFEIPVMSPFFNIFHNMAK